MTTLLLGRAKAQEKRTQAGHIHFRFHHCCIAASGNRLVNRARGRPAHEIGRLFDRIGNSNIQEFRVGQRDKITFVTDDRQRHDGRDPSQLGRDSRRVKSRRQVIGD